MSGHAGRPAADEYAPYYASYIARVPAGDLVAVLREAGAEATRFLEAVPDARADHAYAPGKWTVKEVIGHVTDAERVFAYRALRIARGDATPLPGFDENAYVPAAEFGARTLRSVIEEFGVVREATVRLFANLPGATWTRRGTASGNGISVRALACIVVGHELHHRALLRERYLASSR